MHRTFVLCPVLASFFLTSCESNLNLTSHEGLERRVKEYYLLEQRGDWSAAYEFRTARFRKSVPKDRYVSQMQKDNAGWRLIDFEIKSKSERDAKVYLTMSFKETAPTGSFKERLPRTSEPAEVESEDESIWVRDGDTWYALAAGTRGRLPLNAALVP